MRTIGWVALAAGAAALAGCGGAAKKREKAKQAEIARTYTPPAVTSRLDYGSEIERRFRRMDRNGDDYLTPDELPRPDDKRLLAFDKDGDGKVSEPEYSEGMMARFDANDVNKDGTVTSDEMERAKTAKTGAR